jgi:ribose transport system permease protein
MSGMTKEKVLGFLKFWGTPAGFFLVFLAFSLIRPDVFPRWHNIRNIIEQVATLAIVSAGVTLVMVTGDFDLSVGSASSLTGVVIALLITRLGLSVPAAIAIGFGVGLTTGAVNGVLVAYGGVSAFVGTLATMTSFGGLALLISRGVTVFGLPPSFSFIGQASLGPLPVPVVIALSVVGIAWVILEHTVFGRRLYAIGGNREASYLAGIQTRRIRFTAYLLSGMTAALGGIVLTSRLFSAHPQAGAPFMLNAAAAVFLGMTAFGEGQANILGTFLGVLIMGTLGNGLNILGVSSYVQSILTGGVLILAVLLSSLSKGREV